jgi:hypothetical protein
MYMEALSLATDICKYTYRWYTVPVYRHFSPSIWQIQIWSVVHVLRVYRNLGAVNINFKDLEFPFIMHSMSNV